MSRCEDAGAATLRCTVESLSTLESTSEHVVIVVLLSYYFRMFPLCTVGSVNLDFGSTTSMTVNIIIVIFVIGTNNTFQNKHWHVCIFLLGNRFINFAYNCTQVLKKM